MLEAGNQQQLTVTDCHGERWPLLELFHRLHFKHVDVYSNSVVHLLIQMNQDAAAKKAERFEKLAERRVTEVVKKMRLVGNLANRRNYMYKEEHVRQILEAIEGEMRQVKAKFRQETSTQARAFSFRKQTG